MSPHLDPQQWDELVESVSPPSLLALITSWMGPHLQAHCSADDVLQETLCLAWRDRERHEWHGPRAFRGWLLQIARNRLRDLADHVAALRSGHGRTRPFSSLLSEGSSISALLPPDSKTPSRLASCREQARLMSTALSSLPPEHAEVVRLHLFEDLPVEAVAQQLGIGTSAAHYRFRKGAELYARVLKRLTREGTQGLSP